MKNIFLKILKMIIITTVIWFSYLNLVSKGEPIFTRESWSKLGVIYAFFIIRIIFRNNKQNI